MIIYAAMIELFSAKLSLYVIQPRVYAKYKTCQSRAIAALQITIGLLTVIVAILYAVLGLHWIYTLIPIPCGILVREICAY